jgi:hypothetical protein
MPARARKAVSGDERGEGTKIKSGATKGWMVMVVIEQDAPAFRIATAVAVRPRTGTQVPS